MELAFSRESLKVKLNGFSEILREKGGTKRGRPKVRVVGPFPGKRLNTEKYWTIYYGTFFFMKEVDVRTMRKL